MARNALRRDSAVAPKLPTEGAPVADIRYVDSADGRCRVATFGRKHHFGLVTMRLTRMLIVVAAIASTWRSPCIATTPRIELQGDQCNGVCEFSLCVFGTSRKPVLALCDRGRAELNVRVRGDVLQSRRGGGLRVQVRGAIARLFCKPGNLSPCEQACDSTAQCETANGVPSACVNSNCLATPACP